MSGYGGLSKSENQAQNQAQFDQNVWQPSGEALQQMFGQVSQMFQPVVEGAPGQSGFGQQYGKGVMDQQLPAWQNQMQGGAYADMGLQQNLMNSLNRSQNTPTAMQDINSMIMGGSGNTYADAMRDQYTQDATRAQENMLSNLDARAAASGMSGGARHGVGVGRGMEDINRNLQRNMATTGFETFDKDLDRKLQIAQQADQGTLARQGMMADMLGQQQGAMSGGLGYGGNLLQQAMQQQMMPWTQAGAYANILGAPTVLGSGTSSGTSSGSSKASMGGGGM